MRDEGRERLPTFAEAVAEVVRRGAGSRAPRGTSDMTAALAALAPGEESAEGLRMEAGCGWLEGVDARELESLGATLGALWGSARLVLYDDVVVSMEDVEGLAVVGTAMRVDPSAPAPTLGSVLAATGDRLLDGDDPRILDPVHGGDQDLATLVGRCADVLVLVGARDRRCVEIDLPEEGGTTATMWVRGRGWIRSGRHREASMILAAAAGMVTAAPRWWPRDPDREPWPTVESEWRKGGGKLRVEADAPPTSEMLRAAARRAAARRTAAWLRAAGMDAGLVQWAEGKGHACESQKVVGMELAWTPGINASS